MAEYGFVGDKALQVWYRDTTLRWVRFSEYSRHEDRRLVTIVEYQPYRRPQIALVEPRAMQGLLAASAQIDQAAWVPALREALHADTLQRDRDAVVFLSALAGKRALARAGLGDWEDALREAHAGLALWRDNNDCRLTLAYHDLQVGRLRQAAAQVDTMLTIDPHDPGAHDLYQRLRQSAAERKWK
jgi:hypothetical protein